MLFLPTAFFLLPVLYLLGITTKGAEYQTQTTNEIKVLSLNNLDRWQTDIIIDITDNGVHHWKRNDDGGIDLYYEDLGENHKEKVLRF